MIIQIILLAALFAVAIYAFSQRRRAFLPALTMAAISAVGALFVLAPGLANEVAQLAGVGRGADLILYCFIIVMIAAVFNIHLRLRSEHETTSELTRAIAILSAQKPPIRK